jgi:hypothetical protein
MAAMSVKQLQKLLNEKSGAKLDVDGKYGPKTKAAVKTAQKKLGVKVDGDWGPKTQAAYDTYAKKNTPTKTTKPTKTTTPTSPTDETPVMPTGSRIKFDPKTGKMTYTPMKGYEIKRQAYAEINPLVRAAQAQARNTLQQGKQGLLNQQFDVNKQYATGLQNIEDTAKQQSELASQAALGQGVARSSIARGMQEDVGAQRAGAMSGLLSSRNSALSDIRNQKSALQTDFNNQMRMMNTQRAQDALSRMNALRQQEQDKWLQAQQWNQTVKLNETTTKK